MTDKTLEKDVLIRELRPEDRASVAAIAARAFVAMQAYFVVPSRSGGVIALVEGRPAAVSLVRVFNLPGGAKVGMIAWLMTDPEQRGLGLATKLVNESVRKLVEAGCTAIVTDVEGYNTASANVFHGAGFRRLGVSAQLKRWGAFDLFWLWLRTGIAIDPGHFTWVADPEPAAAAPDRAEPTPVRARLLAIVLNALFALFALSLGGGLFLAGEAGLPDAPRTLAVFLGVAILLLARESAMRLAAGTGGPAFEFRAWEGGWGMSALIAIAFGRVLPLPGNLYPAGDGWRTRDHIARLGRSAVASALVLSALVLAASALRPHSFAFIDEIARVIVFVGKPLLLFDTLVAVAPFEGYNARHLRDYHKPTWLAMSALGVAIFFWR
jgi:ribosomal protein S18 acetylase RimI-like enzyme